MKIADLIASYCTDAASAYGKLRFRTRQNYDGLLRHIERDLGNREVPSIRTRDLLLTHQLWSLRGVHMAHSLIGMLRTLCSYGGTMLEDDACIALAGRMGAMRYAIHLSEGFDQQSPIELTPKRAKALERHRKRYEVQDV